MFISDFAIKRPIITVTVMIALVVFGLAALLRLDTDEFPDIQNPIVAVTVPYPGASPETAEREVVDRLEEQFAGISQVDRIQSTAQDGVATVIVFFLFEKGVDQASQDIRDAISAVRGDLPQEIKEPIIRRFDPNDQPIVSLALSSTNLTQQQLTRLADPGMTRELKSLNGVADVRLAGSVERELTVQVRPKDLQAAGVGVAQVVQALQTQNLAAPVGRLTGALDERTIRLSGRPEGPQDFLQVVVAQRGAQLIRLGQVADVFDGSAEPRSAARFNGRDAIGLDIVKTKGVSTTRASAGVLARVQVIQKRLPAGTRLDVVRNAGERVERSVKNVEEALIVGALLTVLVVFVFLNSWRSTVITGLALPVSVIASFVAVWAFGFTLNTMSLLGLSLAIGILIDDAIVVRENIVRHIEMGEDHYEASQTGTDEIGLAVAATTFSIVAVFVPIAFMSGVSGQWFKPFALTLACSVLVSLFVSFSLDPMLSAYWADPQTEGHERSNPIARALDRFNKWFDRQAGRYKLLIGWALDHRVAMIAIAIASFFGAIVLQGKFGGFGFIPISDRSEITVSVETPPGSNLDYTKIKTEEYARLIRAHKEIAYSYTTIGSSAGLSEGGTGGGSVDAASIYVRMIPKKKRSISQDGFGVVLRNELRHVGGAKAYVFTSGFGGARKQLELELRGPDAVTLTRLAEQIADEMKKTPGVTDIGLSTRGQKPELDVQINRGLAGQLGVSVAQVAQSLRPAFAGLESGDWVDPTGETRHVVVRLAPEARQRVTDIQQLPIVLQGGSGVSASAPSIVPLGQLASITQTLGPAKIDHLDRDRVITIGANVEGTSLGTASQSVMARLAKTPLPPGYRISQGGEVKDQSEVFTHVFIALGIAVMLMYLILVMQFGSFLDPIAIMLSLPLSLIGVVLALLITHDSLNIMSLIGVILLMGIVAKNAILLIDFAKWGRERGMSRRDALIEAGRIRLRPILMTTLALIAGMVPVALGLGEGADFRAPLGRAVIGGVITSTLLTLLVIPTMYEILDQFREWLFGKFRGRVALGEALPEAGD
ncbi:MAG: efflux RND transporter permease subunit [Gemmatimonadota bacterium]|nr:efflux RND transporter permease subunit [Gemmatimonadota bacterium]